MRAWQQRAGRAGLWGLIGVAAAGGVAGFVGPSVPATPPTQVASDVTGVPVHVAGFAEVALWAWLEAGPESEASLDRLFVAGPGIAAQSPTAFQVVELTTVAARKIDDRYWAVTVAATLAHGSGPEEGSAPVVWFLEIGIIEDPDGALGAMSAPAVVAAPAPAVEGRQRASSTAGAVDLADPIVATVDGFLQAMLTGQGDAARYLAPATTISPVIPPPFGDVELTSAAVSTVGDGEVRVRASLHGRAAGNAVLALSYEVELVQRDGRWEIQSISGAPTLAAAETPDRDEPPATAVPTTSAPVVPVPGA